MSESQPITFSAENTPQGFSIEGDGKRFSLDEGEDLTDGKEGKEFGGFINLIGADGKTERFPGGIYDQGDHWQVLKFDGDGGEYLIPKAGGAPEVKQEAAEGVGPQPAEIPVGGLEDAAALAAIDAAPVAEAELPVEVVNMASVKEPVAGAAQPSASEPLAPEPEQNPVSASKSEDSTELSSVHPTIRNTVSRLQEIRREVAPQVEEAKRLLAVETEAKNLRRQAEKVRGSINRLRNKDRISEKIAEEGALIRQAKELEDKVGIARSQDKYKEMDEHKAWRLEARKDATIALEADLKQWEAVMKNPSDFNFYRQVFEKWQQEGGNAGSLVSRVDQEFRPILDRFEQRLPRRLLELAGFVDPRPEGGQKGVDDDIWAIYNQATNQLYLELVGQPAAAAELPAAPEAALPAEEVAAEGVVPEAEAIEGQPVEVVAPSAPEETAAPAAPVEAAEAGAATGGLTGYQLLEGEQKDNRLLGRFRDPSGQVWEGIVTMGPDGKVTIKGAVAEETGAPEPIEAPMPGGVVVDVAEQARAAAAKPAEEPGPRVALNLSGDKPSLKIDKAEVGFGTVDGLRRSLEEQAAGGTMIPNLSPEEANEVLERLNAMQQSASITVPMPDTSGAGIPAAPAEAPAQPEAAAETPEQRTERRKRGFAGALAELDRARSDTSGTEGEQRVRLAEAYNQAIGAATEFMEEGDVARGAVKGFLAGALGTPDGRKLTEIVVGDRLDQAGVTNAPAGEKKKKLEEAGLLGLLELLLELGMSFTDKSIGAVVAEVQTATGAGR